MRFLGDVPIATVFKESTIDFKNILVSLLVMLTAGGGKRNVCKVWESSFVDFDILIFCEKFSLIVSSCSSICQGKEKISWKKEREKKFYVGKLCRCEKAVCISPNVAMYWFIVSIGCSLLKRKRKKKVLNKSRVEREIL